MKVNSNFVFGLIMTTILTVVLAVSGHGLTLSGVGILFLLCYPWTIDGDVYSLFGGYSEKSIYSLIGVIQRAKENAFCLIALTIIQGGDKGAFQGFGVSLAQSSDNGSAVQAIGISGLQLGVKCGQVVGLALWQESDEMSAQAFGLVGIQSSKNSSIQLAGIALYQSGYVEVGQAAGISLYQYGRLASQFVGLVCYQEAKNFQNESTSIRIFRGEWYI